MPKLLSETEVSIALLCQLYLTRYSAVQIKNCLKSTSVIKVATMKSTDNFRYAEEGITCNHQTNTFHCQAEATVKNQAAVKLRWSEGIS